jgi:hypothetical protein
MPLHNLTREGYMKTLRFSLLIAALFLSASAFAQMKKCEELKGEIEGKLKDKGVVGFTLDIVPADQIKDQKVVGSCDGGKNKITYTREAAAPKEEAKPQKEAKPTAKK